jgi:PAS domain S-box-containing protein
VTESKAPGVPAAPGIGAIAALAEAAPVGLFAAAPSGELTFVNAEWRRFTGLPLEDALHQQWLQSVHPDDLPSVQRLREAPGSPPGMAAEFRLRDASGSYVWVRASVIAPRDADGQITGFLGSFVDIAEHKAETAERIRLEGVERTIRRDVAVQHERLMALLRVIPCGVLLEEADGEIILLNDQLAAMFGPEAAVEALIGRDRRVAVDLLAARMADTAGFPARVEELVGERVMVTEEVAAADGRLFERDYIPIFDEDRYRGHVWMYWDFTERKSAEAATVRLLRAEIAAQQLGVHAQRRRAHEAEQTGELLARQNEELFATDALRRQLLATASHELRTPLTSILSFSELLGEGMDEGGEQAQFLEVIVRNAARLLRLLDDLLLLARLGSGTQQLQLARVNLSELVNHCVLTASAAAAAKGISLRCQSDPEVWIEGDGQRLEQALDNVIGNAVKYTPADGRVLVTIGHEGGEAVVSVRDNGIGIPEDEVADLFEQFFRASTARAAGIPGTGLGLPVVRTVVGLHGGSVQVSSVLGEGTAVTLRLPEQA